MQMFSKTIFQNNLSIVDVLVGILTDIMLEKQKYLKLSQARQLSVK